MWVSDTPGSVIGLTNISHLKSIHLFLTSWGWWSFAYFVIKKMSKLPELGGAFFQRILGSKYLSTKLQEIFEMFKIQLFSQNTIISFHYLYNLCLFINIQYFTREPFPKRVPLTGMSGSGFTCASMQLSASSPRNWFSLEFGWPSWRYW